MIKYVLLGVIQGLTEFLPVSSSGHLVIFQKLLGVGENIAFDTVVHLATALAVAIYFWKDILKLLHLNDPLNRKMVVYLVVGTFFTAVIGLGFKDFFESLFSSILAVGFFLILTGVVIILGEWIGKANRDFRKMNIWDAVLVGLAQGCAIAPGLSRSGTTISASLARGLDRKLAAKFSFLLAIPAILGAGLVQLPKVMRAGSTDAGLWAMILGFIAAFLSGLLAIRIFMGLIQRTSLRIFAYYCFVVGAVVLILSAF